MPRRNTYLSDQVDYARMIEVAKSHNDEDVVVVHRHSSKETCSARAQFGLTKEERDKLSDEWCIPYGIGEM